MLSGSNVMFAANVGLGSAADGSANRTTLDWSGARKLALQAGDSPAAVIDFRGEVLEVGGTMLIEVGGVFSASGTVLVSKQDRDVLVGSQTVHTTGLYIGAADVSASIQGIDVTGLDLGLALLKPADAAEGDTRSWLALKADVDEVALDAEDLGLSADDLVIKAKRIGVEMNLAFGAVGSNPNQTVLEMGTTGSGTQAVNRALAVRTGKPAGSADAAVTLDYAAAGGAYASVTLDAEIGIGEFALMQGTFALPRLGTPSVTPVDGDQNRSTRTTTASTLSARAVHVPFGTALTTAQESLGLFF